MTKRTLSAVAAALVSVPAWAACTDAKPTLRSDLDDTSRTLEALDDRLHESAIPEESIRILHHFESGLLELSERVDKGAECAEVFTLFQHFHSDIVMLYGSLAIYPQIMHRSDVLKAWNALVPAFVRLQKTVHSR